MGLSEAIKSRIAAKLTELRRPEVEEKQATEQFQREVGQYLAGIETDKELSELLERTSKEVVFLRNNYGMNRVDLPNPAAYGVSGDRNVGYLKLTSRGIEAYLPQGGAACDRGAHDPVSVRINGHHATLYATQLRAIMKDTPAKVSAQSIIREIEDGLTEIIEGKS